MSDNTTQSNPYSTPGADLSPRSGNSGEIAGRWTRLGAAFIDGIIVGVAVLAPIIFFMGGWEAYAEKTASSPIMMSTIGAIIGFIAYIAINGRFLAQNGQSIGKKLVGIKIVRTDGSKADFARIVSRRLGPVYGCQLIPVIGVYLPLIDVLCIFRDSNQCLHDQIADTIVVKA